MNANQGELYTNNNCDTLLLYYASIGLYKLRSKAHGKHTYAGESPACYVTSTKGMQYTLRDKAETYLDRTTSMTKPLISHALVVMHHKLL